MKSNPVQDGLKALVDAQVQLGSALVSLAAGAMKGLPRPRSGCDIPEPCWMPLPLGEVRCTLAPGTSGSVCLVITNEDFRSRTFTLGATGVSAGQVSFSKPSLELGPKERAAVTATFTSPKEQRQPADCRCIDQEAILWVRGCRNHYLRWTVDSADTGQPCQHEVMVHDQPDYVLHWYDHFYLARACPGGASGR